MAKWNEENLFGDIFADEAYSDEHFSMYVEKEIELKTAGNVGGRFDPQLTASGIAKANWDTSRGLESSDLVQQLSGTKGENSAFRIGLEFIRTNEPFVKSTFIDSPLIYIQFYPRGMGEYTHATKHEFPPLIERYRDAAIANVGAVGVPFKTASIAMVTASEAAHTTHASTIANVSTDKTNQQALRYIMEMQCMDNLHLTAPLFPNDIPACMAFQPFNLLKSVASHAHVKLPGTLTIGERFFVMEGVWAPNMRIRLKAMTGDVVGGSISIAIVTLPTDLMPVDAKKVKNPQTHSFTPADLQTNPTDTCLIVKSNNLTGPCIYEVEIYYVND